MATPENYAVNGFNPRPIKKLNYGSGLKQYKSSPITATKKKELDNKTSVCRTIKQDGKKAETW